MTTKTSERARIRDVMMLAATLAIGCSFIDEKCDDGQRLAMHTCFVAADASPPAADAGSPADGGTHLMCTPATGFGDTCTATAMCPCNTDICAIQPGSASGFCSRSDCLKDTSVCPAGWRCTDLSAFQPGFSMCLKM